MENEGGDEDRIRNPGLNIVIDLNYGAAPRVNTVVEPNNQEGGNEGVAVMFSTVLALMQICKGA